MFDTAVVIPTKNRKNMLLRAVISISKQKLPPKRVIIVDDCSDVPICSSLFLNVNNLSIRIINNKVSLGGAASRNIGITYADTAFVSFLDDDDVWEDCYLSEVNAVFERSSSCNIAVYASKKFVLSTSLEKVFKKNKATSVVRCDELLNANIVGTTSCVTVPKQSLIDIDCFDKDLPALQDYDCWLRLAMNSMQFYPAELAYVHYTVNVSAKQISGNYKNHINAKDIILHKNEKSLSNSDMLKLDSLLSFFVAKAIHRKSYFSSLRYTFRAFFLTKKPKFLALLVPYRVFVFFGVYSS